MPCTYRIIDSRRCSERTERFPSIRRHFERNGRAVMCSGTIISGHNRIGTLYFVAKTRIFNSRKCGITGGRNAVKRQESVGEFWEYTIESPDCESSASSLGMAACFAAAIVRIVFLRFAVPASVLQIVQRAVVGEPNTETFVGIERDCHFPFIARSVRISSARSAADESGVIASATGYLARLVLRFPQRGDLVICERRYKTLQRQVINPVAPIIKNMLIRMAISGHHTCRHVARYRKKA